MKKKNPFKYIYNGNLQSTLVPESVGWQTPRYHPHCSTWCIAFSKASLLASECYELRPFLSWDLPEWTSFVPQATNCSPAVQLQSSTTWQLIPECNTDVSPSRDHCCYCSPPDWEALPAFGIVCQINLANIPQINWCRAAGVRTDIDAEGNSHPESQWQKENVARVSMTGEHSLRRKRWKKVEGGETSREKERENKNDFMGKPWEAEQNLPHQRGESWCRQPDHPYTWRSKAWQCYLVFAC